MIVPKDTSSSLLEARDRYYCDSRGYCYRSAWYSWQRWVVLGCLLLFTALVLLSCACLSARRRRRRGVAPFYGTAWAAPPAYDVNNIGTNNNNGPQYSGQTGYNSQHQYAATNNPPVYSPPANGYYQGNQQSHEMNNYAGGSNNPYLAPTSPPPAHVTKY